MSGKLLSILIPTIDGREHLLKGLLAELNRQIKFWTQPLNLSEDSVEILVLKDNKEKTTGEKRQILFDMSQGLYITFHDDDDLPSDKYIYHQLSAALSGKDCGSLKGYYYSNGKFVAPFVHSIKYHKAVNYLDIYVRFPNHLNCIKKELVKDVKFEYKYFGEDNCWAEEIDKQGLLKTEFEIPEVIYHYYAGGVK